MPIVKLLLSPLVAAKGQPLSIVGESQISLLFQGQEYVQTILVATHLATKILLGLDFLGFATATIDVVKGDLVFHSSKRLPKCPLISRQTVTPLIKLIKHLCYILAVLTTVAVSLGALNL